MMTSFITDGRLSLLCGFKRLFMLRKCMGYVTLALCCIVLLRVFHIYGKEDHLAGKWRNESVSQKMERHPYIDEKQPATSEMRIGWGASPFSDSVSSDIKSELVAARRRKMEALGYSTPDSYYKMGLKQLEDLAKAGDAYAMTQLAEQYYNEADFLKADAGFNSSVKAKDLAEKYYEDAFLSGYIHLAAVISRQMIEEGNLIDAYAWNMLSKSFNDHSNDQIYEKYSPFSTMTDMQKAAAQGKFDSVWQRIVERGR